MTTHEGITTVKEKDYQIPDGYLTPLVKAMNTVFGCCAKGESGGLEVHNVPEGMDLTGMRKLCVAAEKSLVLFFNGRFPVKFLNDSIQPFKVLTKGGKTAVAVTMVGDFKQHLPQGASHSDAFWALNNGLRPKLEQLWRLCKEDPELLQAELNIPQTRKDITAIIGAQGGQITIMVDKPDGVTLTHFQKSLPTYKKFTWGDTSDVLDYVTGIEINPKPEQIPPKSVLPVAEVVKAKKKIVLDIEDDEVGEASAEDGLAKAEVAAPIIKISPNLPSKDKQITLKSNATVVYTEVDGKPVYMWYPPMNITKRKQLRRLYKQASGRDMTVNDMDSRKGVTLTNAELLTECSKSFQQLMVTGKQPDFVTGSDAPRTVTPKPVDKPVEVPETKEVTPVVNKATGKTVTKEVAVSKNYGNPYPSFSAHLSTLDKNGQCILSPELFQEMEDTSPQFYQKIGYPGLAETLGWKKETRIALATNEPEAAAVWMGDLIRHIYNLERETMRLESFIASGVLKDEDEEEVVLTPRKKRA